MRKLGADYAFDITFGADITVMEEAMELVNRLKNNKICIRKISYQKIAFSLKI